MNGLDRKNPVHSVESDEDYYFEINITRSQLSDLICRNEDCEAAKKFAQRGIGPLVPDDLKDPYECYEYYPPPEKKDTKNASTQSPRKFPCGSPKCKYLNVFPDGRVCEESICAFKKSICDAPSCEMNKYTVQAVCGLCGGYSISGQTNFDCLDRSTPTARIEHKISSTDVPTPPKPVCDEECSKPPERNKKKALKPPVSTLPFDQLQAAARKERLVTLVDVFEEVVGRLQELVMYVMECHFDVFNPHVSKTTGHRGQVWANNKFYIFYVDSSTIILNLISGLLKDIWNQSVRSKSATIPKPLPVRQDFPAILLPACQNASEDLANFIVNNLGMKASYSQFVNHILTIFQTAVTSNKNNIPPLEIPNSPIVSKENVVIMKQNKESSSNAVIGKLLYNLTSGNFHLPVRYGHLYCIPSNQYGKMVPRNMGWLWNLGEKFGRLEPIRYYRPGAVSRAVANIIKMHKAQASGKVAVKKAVAKKKKPVEVVHGDVEAMLSVIKREGHYMIKMVPAANPWIDDNKDYSPLIFVISNKRDKIYRVNPDGTEEVVLECDCNSETSSISEGEFEINYIPPVLMVEKQPGEKTETRPQMTQYELEDTLVPPTKFRRSISANVNL